MAKIIIEGSSVAEVIELALSMQTPGQNVGSIINNAIATGHVAATTDNGGEDDGPVNTSAPTHDSTGLPWDARIHASSKATKEDGSWRSKRGVSKEETARVEAELRAQHGQVQQQFQQPAQMQQPMQMQQMPMQQVQQPAHMQQMPMQQVQQPMQMQQMPMQQVQQPMPMQQPVQQQPQLAPVPQDFQSFMQAVSGAMQVGRVDQNYLANVAASHQLTAITDAAARPDLIPVLFNYMRNEGRI